jgi:hypothetical protein
MHNEPFGKPENAHQAPWNKGKLIDSKFTLRTKDVWSILTKLQVEERTSDSTTFNIAIHSMPRACDAVGLKVKDVVRMA